MVYIRDIEQEIIERDKFLKAVGKRIKLARLSKNITIKELSDKTKIKESYLLKIEEGKAIKMSLLKHFFPIAQALKIEPDELLRDL